VASGTVGRRFTWAGLPTREWTGTRCNNSPPNVIEEAGKTGNCVNYRAWGAVRIAQSFGGAACAGVRADEGEGERMRDRHPRERRPGNYAAPRIEFERHHYIQDYYGMRLRQSRAVPPVRKTARWGWTPCAGLIMNAIRFSRMSSDRREKKLPI